VVEIIALLRALLAQLIKVLLAVLILHHLALMAEAVVEVQEL
jgi:hypothetical protein